MKKELGKYINPKALARLLELFGIGLLAYLLFLPLYPVVKYKLANDQPPVLAEAKDINTAKEAAEKFKSNFPDADYAVSPNRLIIKKIGVNAPIVQTKSEEYGLSLGAWHVPETSTPDKGGNTVITGHRFKYLPPNNLTFFLLDKLEASDIISVIWQDKNYYYSVYEKRIVPATEISILENSKEPVLTIYTCDPIYSTKNRLVVTAGLVEE